MPKSLEKTRKKIAKKKGNITALHENSRDSQRLRRAQMRDDKLVRVASARRKNDKPLGMLCRSINSMYVCILTSVVVRAAYFQDAIRENNGQPLELDAIQTLIREYCHLKLLCSRLWLIIPSFVHQHDEEFNELKKERRPGRPASTREDLLRMKIAQDEKEYEDGFCERLDATTSCFRCKC